MALAAPYYSWGAPLDGSPAVNYLGNSYAYSSVRDNFGHFFRTGVTDQSSIADGRQYAGDIFDWACLTFRWPPSFPIHLCSRRAST
jgi:hypothetical protein